MSASPQPDIQPGKLVHLRGRDWVVLPSDDPDLLIVRPLGGSDEATTGIYLPLAVESDQPKDANFPKPSSKDIGDISTARILYDAARLAFRNGAGPFRALANLSFRPRAYQIVPLVMALKQETVRLLIADDVGVGKTVEALLVLREMMQRAKVKRFAVVCLPHLCDQWQEEIRSKIGLEAVIIRSNTQARLDRDIQGDTSVYEYYPYQIISIDYIKSDTRRNVFIQQCPEMIIVDEAHTCAKPTGAYRSQQQRHHLLSDIAKKPKQHLIMLTATPHSGKPEEFQSLLGLLKPEFEQLELPKSSQTERKTLANHFAQRKRADVEKWLGEDTPFPVREAIEKPYDLSIEYATLLNELVEFARKLISPKESGGEVKKAHYWTALGLLRGVMSSPGAGVKMLNTRMDKLATASESEETDPSDLQTDNPIADGEYSVDTDIEPTHVINQHDWTQHQRSQMKGFADRLAGLSSVEHDRKLRAAADLLKEWVGDKFNPVVFCHYLATARYLGEHLTPILKKAFPKLNIQVVTSEDPDDVRKQRIAEMEGAEPRILIATDCLSEGINLQELFTAALHYDLPWNPNRLEQREGRVDRFGQKAKVVKACLLYGDQNPIEGIVLNVLLRKVREIKKATGINVPFPEDSQNIIDTITQSLLLSPAQSTQYTLFEVNNSGEVAEAQERITRKIDEAAEREKTSHSIFAQNAIKAQDIEEDLKVVDEAIGNPDDVSTFVRHSLQNLFGVQITEEKEGYGIVTTNLPEQLTELLQPLPKRGPVKISFQSPTPAGYLYLGRTHCFVEQLCQIIMANTVSREGKRAYRAAVIRTKDVEIKTTLLLFRCRNVIEERKGEHQIVAEEMLLWGWRGTPQNKEYLDHKAAWELLKSVRPSGNLTQQSQDNFLTNELDLLDQLGPEFEDLAETQSKILVDAHERFSNLMGTKRYQVARPVMPMDLMGIYVLLPGKES